MRKGQTKTNYKNGKSISENSREKELAFGDKVLLALEPKEEIISSHDFLENYVFA